MKDEKKNTAFQDFVEEGKGLAETKRSVLAPGAIEYIHLNKRVEDLIQPLWEKIRSKPDSSTPAEHGHLREEIADLPWLWKEVSKDGSSLLDLDKRLHSDLEEVTPDQHHPQVHSHALDDLTDVNVGAPEEHNLLYYTEADGWTNMMLDIGLHELNDCQSLVEIPADQDVLTWAGPLEPGGPDVGWIAQAVPPGGAIALDDLTDVNTPTPTDQFVLTWDAATSKWIAKTVPAGGSLALDDLTDVNTPSPTDQFVLTWDAATSK